LKTDSTTTIAIVAMAIPQTDMAEITFIALCDFLEKRYRRAMNSDMSKAEISVVFQQSVNILNIIK
jgi:hypothetical protein